MVLTAIKRRGGLNARIVVCRDQARVGVAMEYLIGVPDRGSGRQITTTTPASAAFATVVKSPISAEGVAKPPLSAELGPLRREAG